ncbi:MAG: flavodoxin family protein [Syntrophorhabdaceae bacterium]|nr:flavodoxin family protein [Syntrophorhabdaceae bacterium]MDD4197206.1 flavodoxin family protein [Syntrophorhabdaceae bacterium]HOC45329.1 flavodoxin family protein [Syntrophorhabdaceae bacterium]
MKIIALVGSPKGMNGNTAALLNIVLEGARNQGAETETIAIRGKEIRPCLSCDACHKHGVCPQKDAFNAIKAKIMDADGLVLASPNYIFHVSAQLKAFIDRCCGIVHCVGFEGKYGAAVVTSGGGEERPIASYLNHFLAITGAIPIGSVWATMSQVEGQNFPDNVRKKAFSLGENLVKAWKSKTTSSKYNKVSSQFEERMRSLILWRKQEWPYEYKYWKQHRGLK